MGGDEGSYRPKWKSVVSSSQTISKFVWQLGRFEPSSRKYISTSYFDKIFVPNCMVVL